MYRTKTELTPREYSAASMHSEVAPDFTTVYGARAQLKNWSRVPPSLKWAASPFLGELVFSSSVYQSPEWLTLGGIFRNELKLEMQKKAHKIQQKCFWVHNIVTEQLPKRQKPKHAKDHTEPGVI